jgi:hypothetical protein
VWGKPAKRGFYWAFRRKITATELSENSYKFPSKLLSFLSRKFAQLLAVRPSYFCPYTAQVQPYVRLGPGMACLLLLVRPANSPIRLRKLGLNSASSSLFAAVWNWPLFADQYGPRMASAGCPKLALNLPSLPQLLPLLHLPKRPLLLTCSTSQMRMHALLTLSPFLYPPISHLSCLELCADSASKGSRGCAHPWLGPTLH